MTALSDLINARMCELEIASGRELARRTEDAPDGETHPATVAKYRAGTPQKPDDRTLRSLAHALQIPVTQLRRAAGLPTGIAEPFVPPREADLMNARQRAAVAEIIRSMVADLPPDPGEGAAEERPLRLQETTVEDVVVDELPPVEGNRNAGPGGSDDRRARRSG